MVEGDFWAAHDQGDHWHLLRLVDLAGFAAVRVWCQDHPGSQYTIISTARSTIVAIEALDDAAMFRMNFDAELIPNELTPRLILRWPKDEE